MTQLKLTPPTQGRKIGHIWNIFVDCGHRGRGYRGLRPQGERLQGTEATGGELQGTETTR